MHTACMCYHVSTMATPVKCNSISSTPEQVRRTKAHSHDTYRRRCIVTGLGAQVVQEGAAVAPAWTEAMFHELLDQEASPASGAALHHAADIMSLYDTARTRHRMAGMQPSISGRPHHASTQASLK